MNKSSLAMANPKERWLPQILLVLTAVTGMVDAVSYLGLGRVFTANMTGNVILLAFAAAHVSGLSVQRSMTALVAFLLGAMAGGRFVANIGSSARHRWMSAALYVEAALFVVAAAAATGCRPGDLSKTPHLYSIIVFTAVAMGIRNASVRKLAVPDLTTTVLTLTLTGLAADSAPAGGGNPNGARRVAAVFMMFVGAAVGALLVAHSLAVPLAVCGLISAACAALTAIVLTPAAGDSKPAV